MVGTLHPIPPGTCYACDCVNVGVTLHNGEIKGACRRHADPKIKAAFLCGYCATPVRKGSVYVDSAEYAHRKCLREDKRRGA